MTSKTRENLLMLFRNRPTLAAEILRDIFHQAVPSFTRARIVDLSESSAAGTDSEMAVLYEDERPTFAVVLAAQPDRQARAVPELSVLSAMAHGRTEAGLAIGWAFFVAIGRIPPTPPPPAPSGERL